MIKESKDICDIFSIFHDGVIREMRDEGTVYHLKIEIPYLTKRIQEEFQYFMVTLHGVHNVTFCMRDSYSLSKEEFYSLLTKSQSEKNIREEEWDDKFIERAAFKLLAYCYGFGLSEEEVEDVTQKMSSEEVLVNFIENLDRYIEEKTPKEELDINSFKESEEFKYGPIISCGDYLSEGKCEIASWTPSGDISIIFQCEAAQVFDESGREYTISELREISEKYWEEWKKRSDK